MVNKPIPRYLSIREICQILGVSRGFVERAARRGELEGLKVGNRWRFSEDKFRAWIEALHNANNTK